MGGIWLTCCAPERYGSIAAAVRGRDARARLLRFGDASALPQMVEAFPHEDISAALCAPGETEAVERAVASLARSGRTAEILVLVDGADPGVFARLFYAGATEVIASDDADDNSPDMDVNRAACARRGLRQAPSGLDADGPQKGGADGAPSAPPPSRDDLRVEKRSAPPSQSTAAAADPRPQVAVSPTPAERPTAAQPVPAGTGAPVVAVISGRGGVGKTTIVSAMACCSAQIGLRAAMLDYDLMFGNLYEGLGVDAPVDLGAIYDAADDGLLSERAVESTAVQIAPGLTLWGPIADAERAELMGAPCEALIGVLRGVADIVFIDTSATLTDAAAAALCACDRCLIVGDGRFSSASTAARTVALASRLGVAHTRMTSVFNRLSAREGSEEQAIRFEMGAALRSRVRISDGGAELESMLSFGRMRDVMAGQSAFARSVRAFMRDLLRELGCAGAALSLADEPVPQPERQRIRLPWNKEDDAL